MSQVPPEGPEGPPDPPGGWQPPPPPPGWQQPGPAGTFPPPSSPPPSPGGWGQYPGYGAAPGYGAPPPPPGGPWAQPAPGYPSGAPGGAALAGWAPRVGGLLLDGVIGFVPTVVLYLLGALIGGVVGVLLLLLAYVIGLGWSIYLSIQLGQSGSTPGMRVVGLRCVSATTGQPIGGGMGFVRAICHIVDSVICYVGWLFPLWDGQRQTLADKIIGTVVITAPQQSFSLTPT